MGPVDKALWYIESHYEQEISLDLLADIASVSRYHLSHAFSYAMGMPVTRYLRYRRLSQAACALAAGRGDILDLAISMGYGSHEAFTRAFKDYLGETPERVRKQGHTRNLNLLQARRMDESLLAELAEPTIIKGQTLLLAGLSKHYSHASSGGIPGQWQAFGPMIGRMPGQIGSVTYGVIYNGDEEGNFEYLSGVQVGDFSGLPPDTTGLRVPAQTYAVFFSDKHISGIGRTFNTIWSQWLPESRKTAVDAPVFERLPASFDPTTGMGGYEIWLPIQDSH